MADPSDHQTRDTTTEIAETVSMSNTAVDQNDAAGSAAVLAPTQTDTVDTTMTTAAAAATEASKGKEVEKVPTELQQQPPVVPTKEEKDDSLSIEPSPSAAAAAAGETAVCNITLLLPTGARHPYKLDEKYLSKRNVTVPEKTETGRMDPFSISIYTLKELILREWRDEWDNKPASPSSIRLIHFGKLLEDKEQLKSMSPCGIIFVSGKA